MAGKANVERDDGRLELGQEADSEAKSYDDPPESNDEDTADPDYPVKGDDED